FRSLIKHYFLRGKTAKETKEKLDKYYVANTPSDYTVKYWFREFRGGRNSTTDEVRSGRPSDAVTEENVKKIHEMVLADRKVKVRELADATKISTERTRHILGEILHKKKIFFIPREVTFHPAYHTSLIVRQCLARNRVSVLNHPPYSPDLAPCDFSLFPKLKLKLKGRFFDDIPTIQSASTQALEAIPQTELEHAFESLLNRCNKCIEARGEYFE
ncbi:FLJ37770-like protein, partial [Acromyrmex echinatior]